LRISDKLVRCGAQINLEIVCAGSLLHDIGRVAVHDISHGVVGGEIVEKLGYDPRIKRIVETHVLGGFTKEEARKLGLPPKNYIPTTLEEKICCYADKLLEGERIVTLKERFDKWMKKYGGSPLIKKGFDRLVKIEEELIEYQGTI